MPHTDVLMQHFQQLAEAKIITRIYPSMRPGQVSAEEVARLVIKHLTPLLNMHSERFNQVLKALEGAR